MLKAYGEVIAEQEKRGLIERVDSELSTDRKVHFIQHFPVKASAHSFKRLLHGC